MKSCAIGSAAKRIRSGDIPLEKKKHLTLFVVPQYPSNKIRQLRIPLKLFKFLVVTAIVLFLGLSYMVYDYTDLLIKARELSKLKKETTEQKIQLQAFSAKVSDLEAQMAKLRRFDKQLRILANIEPRKREGQLLGIGGPSPEDDNISNLENSRYTLVRQMHSDLDQLNSEALDQEASFTELQGRILKKSSRLAATPSIWPTRGWVTSAYGYRISPFTGLKQKHKGIDVANSVGTEVIAPADGVVIKIARDSGLGKYMIIRHGYGYVTKYGHLSQVYVRVGKRVKRGDKIAALGNTGRSTGPHLHYEVLANGMHVNPLKYILN